MSKELKQETDIKTKRKAYTKTFYKKNHVLFQATIAGEVLRCSIEIGVAYLLQVLLDTASGTQSSSLWRVLSVSGIFFAGMIVTDLFVRAVKFSYAKRAMRQYKAKAFEDITKKNIATFASENTSSYISALTNDAASIEANYVYGNISIVRMFLLFFGALAMMFWYEWSMTLVVIGLCLLPILVSVIFGGTLAKQEKEISDQNENFVSMVKDWLNGFTVIKSFKAEQQAIHLFNRQNKVLESIKCKRKKTENLINIISNGIGFIVQIGVFFYGAYLSIHGKITPGVVIAFVQLMNYILGPIEQLPGLIANRKAAIGLIDKFTSYASSNSEKSKTIEISDIGSKISCQNLSFGYEPDKPVLRDISVSFEKGKSYAIVGGSGSGKSTLLNLLMGSYTTYTGSIDIAGHELKEIKCECLYDIISIIQQNVFVFDSSIRDNITMFKEFDTAKVEDTIVRSGLAALIEQKGEAYACGENGIHLSGGERQRISIARCLLKNTSVLLMDEATAALDAQTASDVSNAILDIEGLTRIIVTHKLEENLLKRFDQIIVLRNGRIEEIGDFTQLMTAGGYFSSLYHVVRENETNCSTF